jgi:hypothetical protein
VVKRLPHSLHSLRLRTELPSSAGLESNTRLSKAPQYGQRMLFHSTTYSIKPKTIILNFVTEAKKENRTKNVAALV